MTAARDLDDPVLPHGRSLFSVLLVFLVSCASTGELQPFTTDGCSSFPDGTRDHEDLWLQCCVAHDLAYWKGGTYGERKRADEELKDCVEQVGEPEIARLMLAGVRVGGTPYLPTSYRWGYGWPWPRSYRPLSTEEKAAVEAALKQGHTQGGGSGLAAH